MEQLTGIDVLAVDHVGVAVPDLHAAIDFYTGTLGGSLEHRERNDEQQIEEAMIAFDRVGAAARIQLIAPSGPDSTIARFLDRSGPGLQQLAVRVPDVRRAANTLRARGLRLLYDEPRRGTAGSSINFVHPKDAGGVLIELVQAAGRAPDADHGADPVADHGAAPVADHGADPVGAARTSGAGVGRASDTVGPGDGTMSA
jgi:methylmalonyl-CoA/ethylmalonyl-CoA epimerase